MQYLVHGMASIDWHARSGVAGGQMGACTAIWMNWYLVVCQVDLVPKEALEPLHILLVCLACHHLLHCLQQTGRAPYRTPCTHLGLD